MPQSPAGQRARSATAEDEPLVRAAIDRSDEPWLSAEAVAAASRLPLERVRIVLDATSAALIITSSNPHAGPTLYSTREHYRATTGLLRRYLDALLSS